MNDTDIVVRPTLPASIIVFKHEVMVEAQSLTTLANEEKVEDLFGMAAADTIYKDGKGLLKLIEEERVKAKAPILDLGRAIDEAAKKATAELTTAVKLLGDRILDFQKAQERERAKAEALRREQEEAERKRKIEEEKARAKPAEEHVPTPWPYKSEPAPAPVYVPPVVKSSAVTTKKMKVVEILDASKIPYQIGGVVLMVPDQGNIKRLLEAGVEVPGCKLGEKEVQSKR